MSSASDAFEDRIWKCVELGLAGLGLKVRREILRYLRVAERIEDRDVIRRPHVFVSALHRLLGRGSSLVISMIISVVAIDFGFVEHPHGWAAAISMARASNGGLAS